MKCNDKRVEIKSWIPAEQLYCQLKLRKFMSKCTFLFKHLIASIKNDYCQSRHFELEKLDHLPNLTLCIPSRDALFQKRTFIDFENKSI